MDKGKKSKSSSSTPTKKTKQLSSSKKSIFSQLSSTYYVCLLIRLLVGITATGYIHPDEYFQSPEITSHDIFGYETFIPWEYDPKNPCRSIIVPFVNSGIPFLILRKLQQILVLFGLENIQLVNGYTLFLFPRLFAVLSSFLLDYYCCLICRRYNLSIQKPLSVLSSCWLMIIFHGRTFSNTMESLVVSTLLTIVLLYDSNNGVKKNSSVLPTSMVRDFFIGIIVSYGIFARFTFIFFAIPIGIYFFLHIFSNFKLHSVIIKCMNVVTGFILATLTFIAIDSWYFGYLNFAEDATIFDLFQSISLNDLMVGLSDAVTSPAESIFTITPINSFKYNMDPANLALHGIHNRLTHLFVNLPQMVGPLILVLVIEIVSLVKHFTASNSPSTSSSSSTQSNNNNSSPDILPINIRVMLVGVIVCGIFFLSLAPHQEARFLLPLFFPLVLLSFRYFYMPTVSSKTLYILWVLFNLFITLFFGFIHQGGIIPSLSHLQRRVYNQYYPTAETTTTLPATTNIVYFHTYMPPRHLLAITPELSDHVHVYDLNSESIEALSKQMDQFKNSITYILSPKKDILYQKYQNKTCQLIESFWPHISTEDLPESFDELRLFLFSCQDLN